MTERERWVVYPLLFLALGAALRDKLVDRTITKSIYCQELAIVDEEPRGGQSARVLARIGRSDAKSGSPGGATFMLDGHLEIIAENPSGIHRLVRLGRTDASPGAPSIGYSYVNGESVVDGLLNANRFAFQGIPFSPAFQMLPGAINPDLWRALQQSQKQQQKPKAPAAAPKSRDTTSPPPAPKQEPKGDTKAPPPAPADDESSTEK
jgi:hypothetical protein